MKQNETMTNALPELMFNWNKTHRNRLFGGIFSPLNKLQTKQLLPPLKALEEIIRLIGKLPATPEEFRTKVNYDEAFRNSLRVEFETSSVKETFASDFLEKFIDSTVMTSGISLDIPGFLNRLYYKKRRTIFGKLRMQSILGSNQVNSD